MLCVPRSWKGLLGSPGTAMGKVNVAKLRYMSRDDFRVLTAVRNSRSPRPLPVPAVRPVPGSWPARSALRPWNAAEGGTGERTRVGFFRSFCSDAYIVPQIQTAKAPRLIISFLSAPLVLRAAGISGQGGGSDPELRPAEKG